MLFLPLAASAQQEYQLVKSDRVETFAFPYSAANRDYGNPLVYTYDEPKSPSWILTIQNSLSYVPGNDAKVITRIQEPAPSEKYIEIAMYGGEFKRFAVSANMPELGYQRLYANDRGGWSTENPIAVSHSENGGLTVTDGKRIVVDRFNLEGFAVGSIAVYGKDEPVSPANSNAGDIRYEILFGSFEESPLYIVPAAVMAGIGAVIVSLLIFKKRKPSD